MEFITEANDIFVGLALNLCALLLVFVLAGRQFRQDRELVFMLGSINIVVFALSYTMLNVSLGMGAAFGLFALFGILRFRTELLGVVEMSFLFAVLALAVVNGSGPSRLTPTELVLINALTVGVLIAGARFLSLGPSQSALTKVQYDRTDLLASGRVDDALSDLADRTGLAAESFEVLAVDLVNKTATLRVRHSERSRDRRSAEPSTITFDLVRDLSSNGKNGQG